MTINKSAAASSAACPALSPEELALIKGYMKCEPEAEKLYTFSVLLCDNEVDRDFERFDDAALAALGGLFAGKSGIFDHRWSAHEQVARIYAAEVKSDPALVTAAGEGYRGLFAKAYMLRSEENEALIASIEAGILKEVSISCAVALRVCSVCGEDYDRCPHEKGAEYEGKLCHVILKEPTDAYEWSFVAVPAQRRAGVTKALRKEDSALDIRDFLISAGGKVQLSALAVLEKEAELGRRYLAALRGEVVRLGVLCACGVPRDVLKTMTDKLDEGELLSLKKTYEDKAGGMFPVKSQLLRETEARRAPAEEYLV